MAFRFDIHRRLFLPMSLLLSVGIGILLGASLLKFGPFLTLAGTFIPVAVYLLFKFPEIVVLALLVLTSGLLPNSYNLSFNLGVGHFQLSDLILISLLGITGIRLLVEREFWLRLAVIGGMLTAVVEHKIPFSYTTYEARILLYYSIFFAVVNLIRTDQQVHRLVYGIFSIGTLVAMLIVAQIALGFSIPIILPTYLRGDMLARAYHPGLIAVSMTMMALLSMLAFQKPRPTLIWIWLVLLVLVTTNIVSLGRNIFISTTLSLVVLVFLLDEAQRRIWFQNLLIVAVLIMCVFGLLQIMNPSSIILAYPKALVERFTHLATTDPTSPDETLFWRLNETRFAWEKIVTSPIVGIGFSLNYRPDFFKADTLQNYIHNGYLWVWLKTGLIGLIPFLWFLLAFLVRGLRGWIKVRDEILRATTLGFTLVVFAMMLSNFVGPQLVSGFNLAFLAAGMGIVEAVLAMEQEVQ
jgi:O-antigen ligase